MLSSCLLNDESPLESSSNEVNLIQRGDIAIVNNGNDSIILLDSNGNFKSVLYDETTSAALSFGGLTFDTENDQLLFNYDSTTNALDSVKSISLYDATIGTVISDSNLAGVLPGLARLTGGELLVLETTATAEKFLATGVRSGAPFISTLTATVADINALSTGGFITCSSGTTNTVRIYDATGAVVATATSASPTPSLGALASTSCIEDSNGRIIVAYSGGTDAVRVYDSSLTTTEWTFTNTNVLTTPGKLALTESGNILVVDTAFQHIVEISSSGSLVRVIGGSVLSTPGSLVVIP
jgi:hypothetical protein